MYHKTNGLSDEGQTAVVLTSCRIAFPMYSEILRFLCLSRLLFILVSDDRAGLDLHQKES